MVKDFLIEKLGQDPHMIHASLLQSYSIGIGAPFGIWNWFTDKEFDDVNIMLFTAAKDSYLKSTFDSISEQGFKNHGFDKDIETKIFTHGFTSNGEVVCNEMIQGITTFFTFKVFF